MQLAAHKHRTSSSLNAPEAAPVHAQPALQPGRTCLKEQSSALHGCGLELDLQTSRSTGQFVTALRGPRAGLPHTGTCLGALHQATSHKDTGDGEVEWKIN